MRKLLLISAIALACASLSFADAFAGLAFEAELDGPAMAAIDGQMFTIFVPFNSVGTATVITRDRGDYCQFTVPVTTFACSNASNPPTNAKKEYVPTPLPVGNYNLGATRAMSNTDCGVGIAIKATA